MNFEDVDLTDINSVGEYIMSRDPYRMAFYNFEYSDSDDVNNAVLECALKIMAWYMRTDNESERETVNDLFEIWQGESDNPDRYEDYSTFRDSLEQHEDELQQVESAIKELSETYAAVYA